MNLHSIESKDNQLIKRIVKLAESKRYRIEENEAVIYGENLVIEALGLHLVTKIFVLDNALPKFIDLNINDSIEVYALSQELMKKINILDNASDILAIIKLPLEPQIEYDADSIVLENIQDPGNLGTILRAARASGIKQVLLSNNSVDIYNPKVLRASQGIQLALNIITNCNLAEELVKFNLQVLALTPHAQVSLYDCDLTKPTAFLLGNEGSGLSDELLSVISGQNHVTIPMSANAESINLAMATTVAAFELSRQRRVK